MSSAAHETKFQFRARACRPRRAKQKSRRVTAELQAALGREEVLLREKRDLCSAKSCWPRNSSIGSSTVCN